MPKKEEEFQINLKILSVNVISFMVDQSRFKDNQEFIDSIRTDIKNEYHSDIENDKIKVIMDCSFYTIENDEKFNFINIKLSHEFYVSPLSKLIYFKDNESGVQQSLFKNNNIIATILSIAYSTTRGILIEKLANSEFKNKFYLPLVDPKNLIKPLN